MDHKKAVCLGVAALIAAMLLATKSLSGISGWGEGKAMDQWLTLVKDAATRHRVPWRWVMAIMGVESDWGRAASVAKGLTTPSDFEGSKSFDGKSWGLMQLTLSTAQLMDPSVKLADLNNPVKSIDLGAAYLGYLFTKFSGDQEKVVRAYNGGPGYARTVLGPSLTKVYYARFLLKLREVDGHFSKEP